MHLEREQPTCCHLYGAGCRPVFFSTDSRLTKGADAAAVIGEVMSGGNNPGAEDDFGVVGGGQFAGTRTRM
jgi:hypothetical protein